MSNGGKNYVVKNGFNAEPIAESTPIKLELRVFDNSKYAYSRYYNLEVNDDHLILNELGGHK